MKKLIFIAVLIFTGIAVKAQDTLANAPEIKFDKLVHDYGTIMKGGDPFCEFTFTNVGKEPLIISNCRSSCGCTVPQWTKEPILPGKTGSIKVRYATDRVGPINKTITVSSNAKNGTVNLRIAGNVLEPPKEVVPEKTIDVNSTPVVK